MCKPLNSNIPRIAVNGNDIPSLKNSPLKDYTYEELYLQPANIFDFILALEVLKNEILSNQLRTFEQVSWATMSSLDGFSGIESVIVADYVLKAKGTELSGYYVNFSGYTFLAPGNKYLLPLAPVPNSININGHSQIFDFLKPFRITSVPLNKVELSITTSYGLDTTVTVKNLVQPW